MDCDQEVGEEGGEGGEGGGDLVTLLIRHLYSTGEHLNKFEQICSSSLENEF